MNAGLLHYRTALQHITKDNAEAVFAFSIVTKVFMLSNARDDTAALLQLLQHTNIAERQRQKAINELAYITARALRTMRGVMVVLVPFWFSFLKGPLGPTLNRDWWPSPVASTPEAIQEDRKLKDLEQLWMRPSRKYEYYFDHLAAALKHLRECFALVSQLIAHAENTGSMFDWSSVVVWLTQSKQEFIALLESQRPEAWVIMAHFAILPSRIKRTIWWLGDFGPDVIVTAALVLGEAKWELIEWPVTAIGVDLNIYRRPLVLSPTNSTKHVDPIST